LPQEKPKGKTKETKGFSDITYSKKVCFDQLCVGKYLLKGVLSKRKSVCRPFNGS
jgi:hypothetical protein